MYNLTIQSWFEARKSICTIWEAWIQDSVIQDQDSEAQDQDHDFRPQN